MIRDVHGAVIGVMSAARLNSARHVAAADTSGKT
jgi:hypothetical protein